MMNVVRPRMTSNASAPRPPNSIACRFTGTSARVARYYVGTTDDIATDYDADCVGYPIANVPRSWQTRERLLDTRVLPFSSLPALLQVARNPSHPYAPHARENLDLLLGQDFGTDWPRWETAIRVKLAKEPKR